MDLTARPRPEIAHHAALDARLAKAAKGVRLLSLASWPASEQQAFLAGWARGHPRLPAYAYPKHDFSDARREFAAIAAAADPAHPLGVYLSNPRRAGRWPRNCWSTSARRR